jgi:aspartate aminotransferase-like enzyme
MFGPNPKFPKVDDYEDVVSHRDDRFISLYSECVDLLRKKFSLQDYDIMLVVGPATLSMQIVLSSLSNRKVKVLGCSGRFSSRWKDMSSNFSSLEGEEITLVTRLETSNSTFNKEEADIVDCVSSFPFVEERGRPKVIVTTVNKILSSIAGISVIAVRKDCWNIFKDSSSYSYTDIRLHKAASEKSQTACTAPVYSFLVLRDSIAQFDIERSRQKIVTNSNRLVAALQGKVVGESVCPVITFKKDLVPEDLAKKFELYGSQDSSSQHYQVFTYSESDSKYEELEIAIRQSNGQL